MNFTEWWIYFGYHVASFQEFIFGSTECCVQVKLWWGAEQSLLYLTTLPVVISPPCRANYAMIPCDPQRLSGVQRSHREHSCPMLHSWYTPPCLYYHSVRWSGPGTKQPPDISNSVLIQRTEWSLRSRWTGGFERGPVFFRDIEQFEFGNRPICSLV